MFSAKSSSSSGSKKKLTQIERNSIICWAGADDFSI
jgi:hypothetical protein